MKIASRTFLLLALIATTVLWPVAAMAEMKGDKPLLLSREQRTSQQIYDSLEGKHTGAVRVVPEGQVKRRCVVPPDPIRQSEEHCSQDVGPIYQTEVGSEPATLRGTGTAGCGGVFVWCDRIPVELNGLASDDLFQVLFTLEWPGEARELKNDQGSVVGHTKANNLDYLFYQVITEFREYEGSAWAGEGNKDWSVEVSGTNSKAEWKASADVAGVVVQQGGGERAMTEAEQEKGECAYPDRPSDKPGMCRETTPYAIGKLWVAPGGTSGALDVAKIREDPALTALTFCTRGPRPTAETATTGDKLCQNHGFDVAVASWSYNIVGYSFAYDNDWIYYANTPNYPERIAVADLPATGTPYEPETPDPPVRLYGSDPDIGDSMPECGDIVRPGVSVPGLGVPAITQPRVAIPPVEGPGGTLVEEEEIAPERQIAEEYKITEPSPAPSPYGEDEKIANLYDFLQETNPGLRVTLCPGMLDRYWANDYYIIVVNRGSTGENSETQIDMCADQTEPIAEQAGDARDEIERTYRENRPFECQAGRTGPPRPEGVLPPGMAACAPEAKVEETQVSPETCVKAPDTGPLDDGGNAGYTLTAELILHEIEDFVTENGERFEFIRPSDVPFAGGFIADTSGVEELEPVKVPGEDGPLVEMGLVALKGETYQPEETRGLLSTPFVPVTAGILVVAAGLFGFFFMRSRRGTI